MISAPSSGDSLLPLLPGLTAPSPPVPDHRQATFKAAWPRLMHKSSRCQQQLPRSLSRPLHSPPHLLTWPQRTRLHTFKEKPSFQKLSATRQNSRNDPTSSLPSKKWRLKLTPVPIRTLLNDPSHFFYFYLLNTDKNGPLCVLDKRI